MRTPLRGRRVGARMAAVLVGLVFAAGCSDPDSEPDPDPPTGIPEPETVTHATDPAECTDPNYKVALMVESDVPEELLCLEDVAACAEPHFCTGMVVAVQQG